MSLTHVRERERMGQSEEKTLPREGGGGGGGVLGRKNSPEQLNTLFISLLHTNALQLIKQKYQKKQTRTATTTQDQQRFLYVLANLVKYVYLTILIRGHAG